MASNMEDPVVLLARKFVRTLTYGTYVRDSLRTFYWNLDGKNYQIENVRWLIENKDYSYRYAWMISNGWKEAEYGAHVEEIAEQC